MKTVIRILCLGVVALSLNACGKKDNKSSTVATTPVNNCVWNTQYGQYMTTGTTTQCTPNAGNCAWSAQYNGYVLSGTSTTCNPGNLGGNYNCVQGQYGYVDQYGQPCAPNGYTGNGGGCAVYNNRPEYNYAYYVPMNVNGQVMCVRYDLVQQYSNGGYQYYGQQNYGCSWNDPYCYGGNYQGGSSTCFNFGGSSSGYDYGIQGGLRFCF